MKITNLRTKITLVTIPMLIVGVVALAAISNAFLVPSFQKIEYDAALDNADRGVNMLNESIDQLELKTAEWGTRDDTYTYVKDHNKHFVDANLYNQELANLNIDYLLIYDSKDQLVAMKHVQIDDPKLPSVPLDPGVKALLAPGSAILQHSSTTDTHKGVVVSPEGNLMLVSRPIITSQGQGPIRGSIVFARYMDAAFQKKFADLMHLNVSYIPSTDPEITGSVPAYMDKSSKSRRWVSLPSNSLAQAFAIVPDIYGQPNIAVRVNLARNISEQGRDKMLIFLGFAFIIGLIIIFTTAYLYNWLFVGRILGLSKQLQHLSTLKDVKNAPKAVGVKGNDEVTKLGAAINELLIRIHDTYDLKAANLTLEQKVAERTKELDTQLQQIKRVNSLMVDRELRMKELKQQIAELQTKLRRIDDDNLDHRR